MFTEGGQITEFYLVNVSTMSRNIHNICILIRKICAKPINISWIFFLTFIFPPSPEISFLAIQSVSYVLSAFEVIW